MHLGYVLKKFPRASETFVLNEILAQQRRGAQVTVFALNKPDDGVFHRGLAELQRPVVYLPARKPDGWLLHLRAHHDLLRGAGPALWAEFDDLLAAGRPDLWSILGAGLDLALLAKAHGVQHLHAHFATVAAYAARAASALAGLPFSVTCHAKDLYRDGIVPGQFQSLLARSAFVVTVCEANARWIRDGLAGSTPLDVRVLYNGVDTSAFHPRHRTPSPVPLVLAVGRLVSKKGFHVLLDAVAALAAQGMRPRVVLVGDGEERAALTTQAGRLGLHHVEFAGMRTHDDVRALVHQATLMVLPCIVGDDGNRDALPTVLLEALAAGLPVVSTPIGGVAEIVDGGQAGVLVQPGDAATLAAAMATLLQSPLERRQLAAAGRARAERLFDLDTNVGVLHDWIAQAAPAPAEVAR
ncbi:MAG: glycosyltransferase family 4 protein [Planctomycetota bacterium]